MSETTTFDYKQVNVQSYIETILKTFETKFNEPSISYELVYEYNNFLNSVKKNYTMNKNVLNKLMYDYTLKFLESTQTKIKQQTDETLITFSILNNDDSVISEKTKKTSKEYAAYYLLFIIYENLITCIGEKNIVGKVITKDDLLPKHPSSEPEEYLPPDFEVPINLKIRTCTKDDNIVEGSNTFNMDDFRKSNNDSQKNSSEPSISRSSSNDDYNIYNTDSMNSDDEKYNEIEIDVDNRNNNLKTLKSNILKNNEYIDSFEKYIDNLQNKNNIDIGLRAFINNDSVITYIDNFINGLEYYNKVIQTINDSNETKIENPLIDMGVLNNINGIVKYLDYAKNNLSNDEYNKFETKIYNKLGVEYKDNLTPFANIITSRYMKNFMNNNSPLAQSFNIPANSLLTESDLKKLSGDLSSLRKTKYNELELFKPADKNGYNGKKQFDHDDKGYPNNRNEISIGGKQTQKKHHKANKAKKANKTKGGKKTGKKQKQKGGKSKRRTVKKNRAPKRRTRSKPAIA